MDSPAGPGAERPVVWSAGTEPTLRFPGRRPLPHRRRGLVLGAAAAMGVLAGVVTTWAEISPVGPSPDTPLWIAPGTDDRMSEVRPRSAPSPTISEFARVKMSELTVVPLTRRPTARRSASPDRSPTSTARARESAEEPRESVSKPSAKAKPTSKPRASAGPRTRSGTTKHRPGKDPGGPDHSDDRSETRSNSGKGSKNSGHSASDDHSGPGS